jgi:hypothetical protein
MCQFCFLDESDLDVVGELKTVDEPHHNLQ